MAEGTNGSGGNGGLYFIVGALVVVVGLLGFLVFDGNIGGGSQDAHITIETPKTN
jgi:hypothetical protein